MAPGQLPDVLERTLLSLAPDAVSDPIRTADGLYLLQSQGQRQEPVGEQQVMAAARMQLYNRMVRERMEEWQRRIRDGAYVEILDPSLRAVTA